MTIICDFSRRFPSVVAMILEQEKNLGRGRFREETFTDLLAASLSAFAGPSVKVTYPYEPSTGADLDLSYEDAQTREHLLVRIQAKRLSPFRERDREINPFIRRYDHLDHIVKDSGEYQIRTLVDEAGPAVPLYAFYHHQDVVDHPWVHRLSPSVEGLNLAFARDVDAVLTPSLGRLCNGRAPAHAKRMRGLQPYFFSFSTLFCPGHPGIPRPRDIAANLERVLRASPGAGAQSERLSPIAILQLGDTTFDLNYEAESPAVSLSHVVKNPTITFISGAEDPL